MQKIIIEPDRLNNCAAQIENAEIDVKRLQGQLKEKIEFLSNNIETIDNNMFTKQLLDNISVINDVCDKMNSYVRYLRVNAKMYQDYQDAALKEADKTLKGEHLWNKLK